MKQTLIIIFLHFLFIACSQEQPKKTSLQGESETNIRLLPKYGGIEKTKEQKEADQKFIDYVLSQEKYKRNKRLASNELIQTGFKYLYEGDLKTAMYRFNQAYLIDSTNTDIYWGYGGVYMMQSDFEKAKEQYEIGLKQNPNNTHLLTDLGTYYYARYHELETNPKEAKTYLDEAIRLLTNSYIIDNKDQNTLFKLSACHLLNGDCENAWKFYNECKAAGGQPISQEYTKHLKDTCKK